MDECVQYFSFLIFLIFFAWYWHLGRDAWVYWERMNIYRNPMMIYENVCMECIVSIFVNWMNDDMKMRIFYSWLNGNACIKLHFLLLIFYFSFFENASLKLYFLFVVFFFGNENDTFFLMRMYEWMHKTLFYFFEMRTTHFLMMYEWMHKTLFF